MESIESFASLAVIGEVDSKNIGIIALTLDYKDSPLTGAWEISRNDEKALKTITMERNLVLYPEGNFGELAQLRSSRQFKLNEFVISAKKCSVASMKVFREFISQDTKSRSKLVEPDFFNWNSIDLNASPKDVASELGLGFFEMEPRNSLTDLIGYARLVRWIFQKWQKDEAERESRKKIFANYSRSLFPAELG